MNRLAVLLTRLMKWQVQPTMRGRSWALTIEEQRRRLASHLADNPSLKARLDDALREAFRLAVLRAEQETGMDGGSFPEANPWTAEQVLDDAFVPN